jgi:hypothetical protein
VGCGWRSPARSRTFASEIYREDIPYASIRST